MRGEVTLGVVISNDNFQTILRDGLGHNLAETVFEQVRMLIAGDYNRRERERLRAGRRGGGVGWGKGLVITG